MNFSKDQLFQRAVERYLEKVRAIYVPLRVKEEWHYDDPDFYSRIDKEFSEASEAEKRERERLIEVGCFYFLDHPYVRKEFFSIESAVEYLLEKYILGDTYRYRIPLGSRDFVKIVVERGIHWCPHQRRYSEAIDLRDHQGETFELIGKCRVETPAYCQNRITPKEEFDFTFETYQAEGEELPEFARLRGKWSHYNLLGAKIEIIDTIGASRCDWWAKVIFKVIG